MNSQIPAIGTFTSKPIFDWGYVESIGFWAQKWIDTVIVFRLLLLRMVLSLLQLTNIFRGHGAIDIIWTIRGLGRRVWSELGTEGVVG